MTKDNVNNESEDLFASSETKAPQEEESSSSSEQAAETSVNGRSELTAAAALTSLVSAAGSSHSRRSEKEEDDAEQDEPAEGQPTADFEIPQRFTKSGRKRAIPFPVKLMKVLSNKDYADVIGWTPSGKSFNIFKPKQFCATILPEHFKSAKYSSFTRKLHRWGFMRHYRGVEAGAYYHDMFIKNRLDLVEQMTCHKQEGGVPTAPKSKAPMLAAAKMSRTVVPAPQPKPNTKPAASSKPEQKKSTPAQGPQNPSPSAPRPMVQQNAAAAAQPQPRVPHRPTPVRPTAAAAPSIRAAELAALNNRPPMPLPTMRPGAGPIGIHPAHAAAISSHLPPHLQALAAASSSHQQQPQQRAASGPTSDAALNAAIEMEVNRRLEQRLASATASRQALAAALLREQEMKEREIMERRHLMLLHQQQLQANPAAASMFDISALQLYNKVEPRMASLALLNNSNPAAVARPVQQGAFGGSMPETNIQGAKTA